MKRYTAVRSTQTRLQRVLHGHVEVSVVEDQQRILATQVQLDASTVPLNTRQHAFEEGSTSSRRSVHSIRRFALERWLKASRMLRYEHGCPRSLQIRYWNTATNG